LTPLPRLTLRKVSILLHLDAGRSYRQIAATHDIHLNTVLDHMRQIARALPPKPGLSHRDHVLRYLDRLLEHNADIAASVRSNETRY
jgi:DNA-binding CsgD family transcriptional regulator